MFVTGDRSPIAARSMFVSSDRTWPSRERKPLTSAFDHLLVGANGLSPRSRSLLANGPGSDPLSAVQTGEHSRSFLTNEISPLRQPPAAAPEPARAAAGTSASGRRSSYPGPRVSIRNAPHARRDPRDDLTHHRLGFGQVDTAIEMDMSRRHSTGSPLAAAPSIPQAAITALVVRPYRRSLHRTPRSGAASIAPDTACHDVPNGGSVRACCEGLRYGPEPFGAHY